MEVWEASVSLQCCNYGNSKIPPSGFTFHAYFQLTASVPFHFCPCQLVNLSVNRPFPCTRLSLAGPANNLFYSSSPPDFALKFALCIIIEFELCLVYLSYVYGIRQCTTVHVNLVNWSVNEIHGKAQRITEYDPCPHTQLRTASLNTRRELIRRIESLGGRMLGIDYFLMALIFNMEYCITFTIQSFTKTIRQCPG